MSSEKVNWIFFKLITYTTTAPLNPTYAWAPNELEDWVIAVWESVLYNHVSGWIMVKTTEKWQNFYRRYSSVNSYNYTHFSYIHEFLFAISANSAFSKSQIEHAYVVIVLYAYIL